MTEGSPFQSARIELDTSRALAQHHTKVVEFVASLRREHQADFEVKRDEYNSEPNGDSYVAMESARRVLQDIGELQRILTVELDDARQRLVDAGDAVKSFAK